MSLKPLENIIRYLDDTPNRHVIFLVPSASWYSDFSNAFAQSASRLQLYYCSNSYSNSSYFELDNRSSLSLMVLDDANTPSLPRYDTIYVDQGCSVNLSLLRYNSNCKNMLLSFFYWDVGGGYGLSIKGAL